MTNKELEKKVCELEYEIKNMKEDIGYFVENCTEKSVKLDNKARWTFTDDEKAILRNLPEEYKWIVRDKDGALCVYTDKPLYKCLFQSIKFEDDKPCEFRKYI